VKKRLIRVLIIILVILLSIALFLFIYEYRSGQEQSFNKYRLTDSEIDSLQDGDIILRHGFGVVSDMIGETMNEKFNVSHCAIVCRPSADSIVIIHSVSSSLSNFDGVQTCELNKFMQESKPNSIMVVRYKSKINKSLSCISKRANYYLQKQVPFDDSFDIIDHSKIYCSELPFLIFKDEFNDDIFNSTDLEKTTHKRFAAFWDTTRFNIIINHQIRKK
jgi:hypothetical protein